MKTDVTAEDIGMDPGTLREIYRQMSRIREVDKGIQAGLSSGKFMFTYWPMTGQEAIPASIAPLVTKDDYTVTIYRGIHDQVAKGVPLKGLFAEALGRVGGVNKGKGGSPHISDPASGSMVTTAIVGAGAPIANGQQDARHPGGDHCQLWRRCHQHRRDPRSHEPRWRLEVAGYFSLSEQPDR